MTNDSTNVNNQDPSLITDEDKAFLDKNPTLTVPVVEPKQEIRDEAAKTNAPQIKPLEKRESQTYESLNIKPDDLINPFNKIKQADWVNGDAAKRDELASSVLADLKQNLLLGANTPSGFMEVPSMRRKVVDGQEVEELVNVPASDASGRLTKAGQDYYNQASALFSYAIKDEKGGIRVNPLTGKSRSMIGSRLMTPYAREEKATVKNEAGVEYTPLSQEEIVSYDHMKEVYATRAKQSGMSFNSYINNLVKPNETLFGYENNRNLASDYTARSGDGEFNNDVGLVEKVKNSPIEFTKENEERLQSQFAKNLERLKAEANMGDKLVDLYDGKPIFNTDKIKKLDDLEQGILELPISKVEKEALLLNFKTNFESQALEIIRNIDTAEQGADFVVSNLSPLAIGERMVTGSRFVNVAERQAASGMSAYDFLKEYSDELDTNIVSSGIEKFAMGAFDSFDSTRVGVLSLIGGLAEGAVNALPGGIAYSKFGDTMREGLQEYRGDLAAGKATITEMKQARSNQLGKLYAVGDSEEGFNITTDDIFDAAGNIAEMMLTLGQSNTLKTLGTIGTRTLSIKASKELGKKASTQALKGIDDVGLGVKTAIDFKEGAKALWQNAEALNTAANVIKTSLYGSFTSAGGGVGEGYSRAIKAGKNEDEALIDATSTGLSNGIATFVAMTVMNGLFPSLGVEKSLIKASDEVGLRTSIKNTIAKNKSSKAISNALKELKDDIPNLKVVAKQTSDAVRGISKSSGIGGFTKSVVFGSLTEGIEEWGDEMLAPVINAYLLKNEDARKQLETSGYWLGALKAGVIGMIMGGVTATGTRTPQAKKDAFDAANQRMDSYIKNIIPTYKGMADEKVSVESAVTEGAETINTLRSILNTGTTEQKVQALTELGRQKIQPVSPNIVTTPNKTPEITTKPEVEQKGKQPSVTSEETIEDQGKPPTAPKKSFSLQRKGVLTTVNINAPVASENELASYAYKQAHGNDLKNTEVENSPLVGSKPIIFKGEDQNVSVTSYTINGKPSDIHSFNDKNGDTVFVKGDKLGKALVDSYGKNILLTNLSKISRENQIAELIKAPSIQADNNQDQQGDQAPEIKPSETSELKQKQENKGAIEEEQAPAPEKEEKVEDILDEGLKFVGESKLKPKLQTVWNKYKNYFKKKNVSVLFVKNKSELDGVIDNFDERAMGFATILNYATEKQKDVIVILTDEIENLANALNESVETILEDAFQHENFHIVNYRFDRTKTGSKLRKNFEDDLLENKRLNDELDVDYSGFSKLKKELKFLEFTRAFVSGKLTNRTLSAAMSVSPAMKKWVNGFIKFAKKEIKKYKGAQKYLSKLEKAYIEAIKDDAELFNYSPSATEAFKNYLSGLLSRVTPTRSRKKSKILTTKEIDYTQVDFLAQGLIDVLRNSIDAEISPQEIVPQIIDIINGYAEDNTGLGPQAKKEIFNKIVEEWKANETDKQILKALQDSANKIGSIDTAPHIQSPVAPATRAVLQATEERLAYNQYTRIRRSVDERLVLSLKNEQDATAKVSGKISVPASAQNKTISNAYIGGIIDQDTGEIISLGFEPGDVVSVVNPKGEVTQHLVYVKSDIVIDSNGNKEARHEFLSGVISENGKLTSFGIGVQAMFSDKFRNDFEESGLVDKMFGVENGALKLDNIDSILEFVFQSLTSKSINSDGQAVNSLEVAGKVYAFNDLFSFDASMDINDANASPFYYQNGKIVVNTEALRNEFSFINDSLLRDADNKKTIGLLIAQAVRTAVDEELLHHITTLTFNENELVELYNDLRNSDRFNDLLTQIANAQGIYSAPESLTDQQRYVIATEFLAFINQKSFDGATYADQYNQLLRSYASVNPDGKALATATLYGKRFKDILIARSATSLMAPRLIDMVNKLSVVKKTVMPRQSSSNIANFYANFNQDVYANARNRMQKIIDDAFVKQFSAVNDLRSFLYERKLPVNNILFFDFENNTVNLSSDFRSLYAGKVDSEEMAQLDDYFSRLNKDSVVREFVSSIFAAKANLDSITEQVASNVDGENLTQDPDIAARFQRAVKEYNDLQSMYGEIILNKNLSEFEEFGRSFAPIGVELGFESSSTPSEQGGDIISVSFTRETENGPSITTSFSYEANLFGYENQSPLEAISSRSDQKGSFANVGFDIERAKTETIWFNGYKGRFTTYDRENFPEKVAAIESNAAFLGEQEFNFFYISRINGETFKLEKNDYSYSDFRKMMGFNPIDSSFNQEGERVLKSFNEVVNKFIIPDEELQTGVTDKNTGKPLTVTIRSMSQSNLIKKGQPERRRIVLASALQQIFPPQAKAEDNEQQLPNISKWIETLENLIGYNRADGTYSVVENISGRETFASKFAKQLIYRIFNNKQVYGVGAFEKIDETRAEEQSLYGMLKEFESAYYALFPSVQKPDNVKKFNSLGQNKLSDNQVDDLIDKLPVFLESIDALNQDVGLARKAYTRFTSSYLLNTIKGDIRLVQEQNTEGLRANQELLKAIQYSFYDIQAMEDIEFLMEFRNNGGRNGINGIIALNLLDQLSRIPSSAQNEYYIANTPSENVKYLLERYTTYLENGMNPRMKDADGKSTYPTDNLVFGTFQKYGDRPSELDEEFSDDRATKPSDTAETLTMSGVAPVTGRDEASQEAIDSARREAMHEEVKKMKSWTFQAAISIFQKVVGSGNKSAIDGLDPARAKRFFRLFANLQNRPTQESDFGKQDFIKLKEDSEELKDLMLEQLQALSNHYKINNEPNLRFAEIANNVRKSAYVHPMEFLVDVVEAIGEMERAYLSELTDAGKTLADFSLSQLKKEIPFSKSAVQVDQATTSFVDTSALQEKLNSLISGLSLQMDSPSFSPSIVDLYKNKISEIEKEIEEAKKLGTQSTETQAPIKRYVKKDTTTLRNNLEKETKTLEFFEQSLFELRSESPRDPSIGAVEKEVKNQQAKVQIAKTQLDKVIAENEKADQQIKTPMEDLESQYQELRSKLYTLQRKVVEDEQGNVVPVERKVAVDKVSYFSPEFEVNAPIGITRNVPVSEIIANPELESMMQRVGVMIAQLQNEQEKPASMLSYNQEQAQLVFDSMLEDQEKGQLTAGTVFYARTFKFKSDQSLIDDRLFTKSPLFSVLIQSMPNLIVYQPNTNYEGKVHQLPDGAGLVQLSNGDNILYITNPDQLSEGKQAEILELLIISQIKNESDNGSRPSVFQQTINEMADVVRKQAQHAINMTPDRISVMVARAEQVVNGLTTIDSKTKQALISRYEKALTQNASNALRLMTDRKARRQYIENRVSNRAEGVETFFNQLINSDKENGQSSTIENIQMIVDMFTNPDSYRLLSTFKSPDLDFNGFTPLPQYDALLAQALSFFAIAEVKSSQVHEIAIQKGLQSIDEAKDELDDDDVVTDPNLIYEAIAENFADEKRTGKKLAKPEILNLIKQMSDNQIKDILDPLILERYFTTERSPEVSKNLLNAFKQNMAQPDFLYRYVGSQLLRSLEPVLISADPSIKQTSLFEKSYPSNLAGSEMKAYDVLFESGYPVLMNGMIDPAITVDRNFADVETRVPTGNITNFYYGHNPMTETYRMNRRKNLLGMLLGKTETGESILDDVFNSLEAQEERFSVTRSIDIDQFPGVLANMIEELPALLGDDVVSRAQEIVDRIERLSISNKQDTKDRIAVLEKQLEKVKQEGREFLLEKLIERNKQALSVAEMQLNAKGKTGKANLKLIKTSSNLDGEFDSKSIPESQIKSLANQLANYLISQKYGLNQDSYNLADKLQKNANKYLAEYLALVGKISEFDQSIESLFDTAFNQNIERDNFTYEYLLSRRNTLVDKAEIKKAEYIKLAAIELLGTAVNPAYSFGKANQDVQAFIQSRLGRIGELTKIKYSYVSPMLDSTTPSAVLRSIRSSLVTKQRKNSFNLNIKQAFKVEFASELLEGLSAPETKMMFASLGPDMQKNFSLANAKLGKGQQGGYLNENFKSQMVKEFFSRLKGDGALKALAQKLSEKIDVQKYGPAQIRRMVFKEISKDKGLNKILNDEFLVTDLELNEVDEITGKRILDGNIDAKIEKIESEIDRLTRSLNSERSDTNEVQDKGSPRPKFKTLFEMPAYRYPNEDAAIRRMNLGMPASRKVNVRLIRTLDESMLQGQALEQFNAVNSSIQLINEAMNIFLEEEGEIIYKALTEEIDLFGEGFDIKQNIHNVIELTKLKKDISEKLDTKFGLMLKEMSEIDTILNEADQPALELYGMTLRDMIKLGLSPATVTPSKDGDAKTDVQIINERIARKSEVERIKQTALFIKTQAGLAVFMPTDGKLTEKSGRSYLVYDRSALNHLKSYQKITKQKTKPENLLKDAIFRASRSATGFDSFLKTQSHEDIDLDLNAPITPELAVATKLDPATTKGDFIKIAKRLFNEYFLREKHNYVFSSFAKGIGIVGSIKKPERMNQDEINKAFDSVHAFASDAANNHILQSSGFELLLKTKQDYDDQEKANIVKKAYDIAINENKFITPDSHAANSILLNESMFEDVIMMLESNRFAAMNKNNTLSAYKKAAIDSIASVFTNEMNTANSTSGKFFNSDTAIARLDLRQNYSRLYSLLYADEIFRDLYSGVVAAEKRDSNNWFTHSNALIRQKFARSFGAYSRALSLQGLIEQGINGNAGRNKFAAKYQEYQNRIGKAANEIGNDFDLGSRAYVVAVAKGIIEANNRDGGTDLDLAMKLHYFASAYNSGIRDHQITLQNIQKNKATGNMFSRVGKLFSTIGRKQSREDANIQVINDLIGSEMQLIARRDPKSVSRQEVQSYVNQIENLLYDGFDAKTVSAMNKYSNALLEEFTEIYEGHRIANAFASEETLRGIEDIVDPEVGRTAKTFRNSYSVLPLRFGHVKNPLTVKDETVGNGTPTIDSFINFEQSLMNYKGRTIYDLQNENFVRVLRPLDLNPFTAPDQIANDAIYRMYMNPSYTVIRKMLGEYGVDANEVPKTEKGHLIGALKQIYNISNNQSIERINQYGHIAAYIIDKINTEIKNDMPMDLADSLLADAIRMSNVHLLVKTLGTVWQIWAQGILPAFAKYINVKLGKWTGLHQKSGARLREAYALAFKDYFTYGKDGEQARFVKENSTNSYKWKAEGANERDTQISMTKYASQNHLVYLARFLGANVNKLGEKFLDVTIGKPERALVQAIYAFELFSQLEKEMGRSAPKTIKEMLKMNPDQFSAYAKTKADTMVTDFMGIGDRAKKARIYNLPKNRAVETLLLSYLTRYGNHALTVGPNMMVNMDQLYKQLTGQYSDEQMRNEAIENVMGTLLQTLLFRFGQTQVMIPNLVWLYYSLAGMLGGDKDDEDELTATQKTLQLLRDWDVHGEVDFEDDTFINLLSRRVRAYTLPEEFAVTKRQNKNAKFFASTFRNSPILEANLQAVRKSMLDTMPVVSLAGAGSALSVPLVNSFVDLVSEIAMMGIRKEDDWSDISRIAFKTENIASAPVASLLESYQGAMNTISVPLNYFAPKEGKDGISLVEMLEGLLVAPLGSREYRPTYYERIKRKGGWGDY